MTILDLPPAYLQQQAEELRHAGRRIAVRACILGGEAWDASLLTQQAVQAEAWFNAYGPTEAVITRWPGTVGRKRAVLPLSAARSVRAGPAYWTQPCSHVRRG